MRTLSALTKNRRADSNLRQVDNYNTEFTGYRECTMQKPPQIVGESGLPGWCCRPMLPLTARLTYIARIYLFTARATLTRITRLADRAINGTMKFASLSHEMKSPTRILLASRYMYRVRIRKFAEAKYLLFYNEWTKWNELNIVL